MLKFEGDREPEINHIVKKEDLENKKLTGLTQIIKENKFLNDYSTKYTDETLRNILYYLKDGKYSESIEVLRKSKKEIVLSNQSTLSKQKIASSYRHFLVWLWIFLCQFYSFLFTLLSLFSFDFRLILFLYLVEKIAENQKKIDQN